MSISLTALIRPGPRWFLIKGPAFLRATFYLALQWHRDKIKSLQITDHYFLVSAHMNIINLATPAEKIACWQDSLLLL